MKSTCMSVAPIRGIARAAANGDVENDEEYKEKSAKRNRYVKISVFAELGFGEVRTCFISVSIVQN